MSAPVQLLMARIEEPPDPMTKPEARSVTLILILQANDGKDTAGGENKPFI
jgi:hypothetical protein